MPLQAKVLNIRRDIEGLRAISIAMVVLYHYFPAAMPGGYVGVDVFFVISGYLITLTLVQQSAAAPSRLQALLGFWMRRARRLLPQALLLLSFCATAGLWLSEYSRKKLGSDIFWSAYYSVNWLYVLRATNYLRWDENKLGILLNFWSLAVEEQFYLVWPLVVLGLCPPGSSSGRRWLAWSAISLAVASLVYGVWLAQVNMTLAFFASPARFWELLVGAGLAMAWPGESESHRRPWLGELMAGLGLVCIAGAGWTFSEETRHPGLITLWPVLSAASVIAAARWQPLSLVARALAWRPIQYLGARSYGIYLWHWPLMILGRHLLGPASAEAAWGCLALSLVVAEASWRFVETPARFQWAQDWSARRILVLALIASSCVAMAGFGLRAMSVSSGRELLALKPGASALGAQLPAQGVVEQDLPTTYGKGCHLALEALHSGPCEFGDTEAAERVVLFGDSHAAQWFPALDEVARRQHVRLVAWTKSSCPAVDVSIWNQVARGVFAQCDAWRSEVMERLLRDPPRRVILSNLIDEPLWLVDTVSGRLLRGREAQVRWREGLVRVVQRLQQVGTEVVVLRDTPRPRPDIMDCLYSASKVDQCSLPLHEAMSSPTLDLEAAREARAVVWDLSPRICPDGECPVVLGGPPWQVVYRDTNHLTASYVRTLAPDIERLWLASRP